MCWDLGANTGRFSRIAADLGYRVLSFDIDPAAAERHYRSLRTANRTDTTPLVMDLADPSPGLGWAERERSGFLERANADVILALALVHHLAIGRNVPLPMVLDLFADLAPGRHRGVGAAWRPDGRRPPRVARGRVHRLHHRRVRGCRQRPVRCPARTPIEGSPRVLYHLERR